ncbi:MAG: sensor histidine kinase [Myxococcales bacterium]|jgi:two-component system sensor histidine kinase/response regulator
MEALKVLIVDDELGMRVGASRVLERYTVPLPELSTEVRFEVDLADSGEAALEKLAQTPPDILLLDHKLPGMTGLEVLERLAAEGREVLTVMITAYATLETAVTATKRGAFDFLAKPFTPDELRATITKASKHVALQRQARRHEEEKRRIKFEFVRVLAHELKAPLAAVEGYLMAMQDRALGEELRSYDPMVERSLVRLAGMRKLVIDLLDMTRLESGQKKREMEELDVREIALNAIETARAESERRRIAVTLHGEHPVPFFADRSEIELVLNNLVTNAVKYNRDGGQVDIHLDLADDVLRVRVSDTGIGLTPEDIGRLFKDFVRIKNEKTRNISGSGLGLSTVKKVAELYGGEAKVESQYGVGSTFEVTLRSGR